MKTLEDRFKTKYMISDTGCWLWIAGLDMQGYGIIWDKSIKGGKRYAHRFSYELYYGEIPGGLLVCHKCDIRNCVNPKHLFLGTISDNIKDMYSKGRNAKGEDYKRILKSQDIIEIIRLCKAKEMKQYEIAEKYGVNQSHISRILNGHSWKHISLKTEVMS